MILNDTQSKNVGLKNLVNVFRRLHRIFAHAWFQHRSVFWAIEGQSGLYVLFKTVCDLYDLLPAENYKLPPEAEGLEAPESESEPVANKSPSAPTALPRIYPRILKPSSPPQQSARGTTSPEDNLQSHGQTTTRRHIRSSPSTGSAVMTVMETDEEEADALTRGLGGMQLAAPSPPNLSLFADEPENAEVPAAVNEALDGTPAAQSVETVKADDAPEEANETAAKSDTRKEPEAGSAVVEKNAKVAEPTVEGPSTTPAVQESELSPVVSTEAKPGVESADANSGDRDVPATGQSGVDAPVGQDSETAPEVADTSKPSESDDAESPEGSSTTETTPSATVSSRDEAAKDEQ